MTTEILNAKYQLLIDEAIKRNNAPAERRLRATRLKTMMNLNRIRVEDINAALDLSIESLGIENPYI